LLPSVEISLGDFLQKAAKETKIGLGLNPSLPSFPSVYVFFNWRRCCGLGWMMKRESRAFVLSSLAPWLVGCRVRVSKNENALPEFSAVVSRAGCETDGNAGDTPAATSTNKSAPPRRGALN